MSDFPFVFLPWHKAARALIDEARKGCESAFFVGAPGVGKSELLLRYTQGWVDRETQLTACGVSDLASATADTAPSFSFGGYCGQPVTGW